MFLRGCTSNHVALSSKYSLALYEMIQKRGNMARTFEEMTIDEFRSFLGVPAGKLNPWINFKNFAIAPAVREVSDLSDFKVKVEPVKGKGAVHRRAAGMGTQRPARTAGGRARAELQQGGP